jgi:endoglucanase
MQTKNSGSSSPSIYQTNQLFARTLNVGLHLGDPKAEPWGIEVTGEVLDRIKSAGFTAIRLGVHWAAHTRDTAPYPIDPQATETVRAVIADASARGLAVVLSNFLDPQFMQNPPAYRTRFLAIASQVGACFRDAPVSVAFELMAEPQGRLDAVWNEYLSAGLAALRETNPTRAVVVGPASYNNARKLGDLKLPADDRNLIVTLHHYWPLNFTMQGEAWFHLPWYMTLLLGSPKSWPGTPWDGAPRQQAGLRRTFDTIASWGKTHERPIFVGEFGSSNTAVMASRARWAAFVRRLCEERGMSWGYWSYGPSFALYDFQNLRWHAPLLEALLG